MNDNSGVSISIVCCLSVVVADFKRCAAGNSRQSITFGDDSIYIIIFHFLL